MKHQNGRTELLSELEGEPRFVDGRARHHEFAAPNLLCPVNDALEVIRVALFSAVLATEDGISEVDADLQCLGQSGVLHEKGASK